MSGSAPNAVFLSPMGVTLGSVTLPDDALLANPVAFN
jgi:hypothetical protein